MTLGDVLDSALTQANKEKVVLLCESCAPTLRLKVLIDDPAHQFSH